MTQPFIVDLFAGGGGASAGIALALGVEPAVAVNHCPLAIAMHEANHPRTRHFRESVFAVSPIEACGGHTPDLLWASPDCTHHSRAKGGAPRDNARRGLASVVVDWARAVRPKVIVVENVEEFVDWGPLDVDGHPIAELAGQSFQAWVQDLRDLGYTVDWRVLVAADFGAPTIRERVFVVARDGGTVRWPTPTHGPGRPLPWVSAGSCVDWSDRGRPVAGRQRPLVASTLRRIETGFEKHVQRATPYWVPGEPAAVAFMTKYYSDAESQHQSLWEPCHTLTTHDRFGLVVVEEAGVRFRVLSPREQARMQGFADDYQLVGTRRDQVARIGNSVSPHVARAVVAANVARIARRAA